MVAFSPFYQSIKSFLLRMKCMFKYNFFAKCLVSNKIGLWIISRHLGRVGETQLQAGENLNYLIYRITR